MIKRTLQYTISEKLKDRKVIIILGPRQVGKSTLLKLMQKELNSPVAHWNGDEADIRAMLKDPTSTLLKNIIGSNKTIIIDKAQRIENIGLCIKLIYETWKIERKNLNFKTHLKRLNRRTICYSKNEQIHDIVISIYIERYYYKTGTYSNNDFSRFDS